LPPAPDELIIVWRMTEHKEAERSENDARGAR